MLGRLVEAARLIGGRFHATVEQGRPPARINSYSRLLTPPPPLPLPSAPPSATLQGLLRNPPVSLRERRQRDVEPPAPGEAWHHAHSELCGRRHPQLIPRRTTKGAKGGSHVCCVRDVDLEEGAGVCACVCSTCSPPFDLRPCLPARLCWCLCLHLRLTPPLSCYAIPASKSNTRRCISTTTRWSPSNASSPPSSISSKGSGATADDFSCTAHRCVLGTVASPAMQAFPTLSPDSSTGTHAGVSARVARVARVTRVVVVDVRLFC